MKKMNINLILSTIMLVLVSSCIKDDFIDDSVDPVLRITVGVDTLAVDSTFQFSAIYLNEVGSIEEADIGWSSSNQEIISIDSETGVAEAIQLGSSIVFAHYDDGAVVVSDSTLVHVGENTVVQTNEVRSGTIASTSSYLLTGDFILREEGNDAILEFATNYAASTALPGLYVYLSNNPNSRVGALEIGPVTIFSGAHSYTIADVAVDDYSHVLYYCAPFNVKVGDGAIQ